MLIPRAFSLLLLSLLLCLPATDANALDEARYAEVARMVNGAVPPLMKQYAIPGLALAITIDGERLYFNFGVQSKSTQQPVTETTLFEIGSISKTFTAALAAYAQRTGAGMMSESVSSFLPSLRGSAFDQIRLLDLATHTSGGLPLHVPEGVTNERRLLDFLRAWKPAHTPGTRRSYSNVSIGLLGMAVAQGLGMDFEKAVAAYLFSPLGLTRTFFAVPASAKGESAQGYDKADRPVQMDQGLLSAAAYGIRSCSMDLLRYLEAVMGLSDLESPLKQVLDDTRYGYVVFGGTTQCLVWEQYGLPATINQLRAGNSSEMIFGNPKAERLEPPLPPQEHALLNKTGSTKGFSAYVMFIPAKKTGIVLLANKNYPNEGRIAVAWQILTALEATGDGDKRISGSPPVFKKYK